MKIELILRTTDLTENFVVCKDGIVIKEFCCSREDGDNYKELRKECAIRLYNLLKNDNILLPKEEVILSEEI